MLGTGDVVGIRAYTWDDVAAFPVDHAPGRKLVDGDLAYIMYTSGSTGKPKGITHTHYSGLSYVKMSAVTSDHDDPLRTVIIEANGTPHQRVTDDLPAPLEFIDLTAEANPDVALDLWVDRRRARSFALDTCLYDSVLLKLSDVRYAWYFSQHHIIMDVTSAMQVFARMGTPLANRGRADFREALGLFIEVLSLGVEVAPDETFRSLVFIGWTMIFMRL